MPDTIDHIEVVKGTHPKRVDGKTVDETQRLIFVETSNGADGNEWYTIYTEKIIEKLTSMMLAGSMVKFAPEGAFVKDRQIVNRSDSTTARPAKFNYFNDVS